MTQRRAVDELPAHLAAALRDPSALEPLLDGSTAAWEQAVAAGVSPQVTAGLAMFAIQAAIAVLRLGLIEGRVQVALGRGPGLIAEGRPFRLADAVTWIDAWYLTVLADLPEQRAELAALRSVLPGPPWAVAWADVLCALDHLDTAGEAPANSGWLLGAAERLVPVETAERALLPCAAALLTDSWLDLEPPSQPGWGYLTFLHLMNRRSP